MSQDVRELMRSTGQLLGGIGLLIAALIYTLAFRVQRQESSREARSLLLLLGAELDNQSRTLYTLNEDPERLTNSSGELIETSTWDENAERIARALSYSDLNMLYAYYANVRDVKDRVPRFAEEAGTDDGLRYLIQYCMERLPYLQQRVHLYVIGLEESQGIGK